MSHIDILELKYRITKIKAQGVSETMEGTEERVHKLENKTTK